MSEQMTLIGEEVPVNIEDEMRQSYMDYAMSVIVSRALPDARDGLKPVHRRILYAMEKLGNRYNQPYKKSARIVGDVVGKYHPHGESAVYDALVRMAQDFSMRYPLVDGQGNFGSIDGDPAAAMRYTEVRMDKLASELLSDIKKDTVNFVPNYDDSLTEPEVLPAKIPNLLINGASGIAVGMSTNIPPHNLGEVIDGVFRLIDDPDVTVEELMESIPAPDFPTGGIIFGSKGIEEAYKTGRGVIKIRARTTVEETGGHRGDRIIVKEIPYQLNKNKLIKKIAKLVKEDKLEGISDLRDESDRHGMRLVIELKRGSHPDVVLNNLYKKTRMEASFGIILIALVNGRPELLNLKEALKSFLDHRIEVVTRRIKFELRRAEDRAHILEGLKTALDELDAIISLIRGSENPAEAKKGLIKQFDLSEKQAQAILDMKLQRLTGLERDKVMDEYQDLLKEITRYKEILDNRSMLMGIIKDELEAVREEYDDFRKTKILEDPDDFDREDLIMQEEVVITYTHSGYIKRTPVDNYRKQRRGGKGVIGMVTKDEDMLKNIFVASTHDYLLIFTTAGKVYWLKGYNIPEVKSRGRGRPIVNLVEMSKEESIASVFPVSEFHPGVYVVTATREGYVKKTSLEEYNNPRTGGIKAQKLEENDSIVSVHLTDGERELIVATKEGKAIRFDEEEVRSTGRVTRGVTGIKLEEEDSVVDMQVVFENCSVLSVTENGYGKRTDIDEFTVQHRGGKGLIAIKTSERNGKVSGTKCISEDSELMMITQKGKIIRIEPSNIRVIGRNTQGVKLIELQEDDRVVAIAKIDEERSLESRLTNKENGESNED